MVDDLMQRIRGPQVWIDDAIVLPEPSPHTLESLRGFFESGSRPINRPPPVAHGLALFRQARGEQFLFGLGQFVFAKADLFFPIGLPVVLEPRPGMQDIVFDVIQDVPRAFEVNDQAGPESIQSVNGRDFGLGLHGSALGEVFLDPLSFAQEERHVLIGDLHELRQSLHRAPELVSEPGMFLVLPGVPERRESRLEQTQPVPDILVKPFEFVGESPDLGRIHDGL
jgi:hypothetical protein